jgi:biotin carboxyl carrier protein
MLTKTPRPACSATNITNGRPCGNKARLGMLCCYVHRFREAEVTAEYSESESESEFEPITRDMATQTEEEFESETEYQDSDESVKTETSSVETETSSVETETSSVETETSDETVHEDYESEPEPEPEPAEPKTTTMSVASYMFGLVWLLVTGMVQMIISFVLVNVVIATLITTDKMEVCKGLVDATNANVDFLKDYPFRVDRDAYISPYNLYESAIIVGSLDQGVGNRSLA